MTVKEDRRFCAARGFCADDDTVKYHLISTEVDPKVSFKHIATGHAISDAVSLGVADLVANGHVSLSTAYSYGEEFGQRVESRLSTQPVAVAA